MNADAIKNRTASIMIVEQSTGVRPAMKEALRELGFSNSRSVSSLEEALSILAAEPIDWLISSLFPESNANALQVLKLSRSELVLKNLKVSLFLSESERTFLSALFENGLFSWHEKPFNKDFFQTQIEALLNSLQSNNWNFTFTSAEYLRPLLKSEKRYTALLEFEQKLSEAFPEHIAQLLNIAEAHFLSGSSARARALLWQAEQRRPELEAEVKSLSESYLSKEESGSGGGWLPEALGVCMILEPDTLIQASLKDALSSCGATDIHVFDNGELCWQWLKENKEPELLVTEWRTPGITCPTLVQRCRSHGYQMMSIIVHSSLVKKQDQPLLVEMGVNDFVPKPFRKDDFLNCVAATMGQSQRPTEIRSLEHKIRALITSQQVSEAKNLMGLYQEKFAGKSDVGRLHIEAEFAFAAGEFNQSREHAMASIRLGNKSVSLLNLLGKTLMQLRDFPSALKIFQSANNIAPGSISRLCAIAETQQELGDTAAARAALEIARDLDPSSQDVINSSVKIGIAIGDADLVKENINAYSGRESILAYVNNKAVALSKTGDLTAAIALYKNALGSMPNDHYRFKAVVGYNLSLAFARKGDNENAIAALNKIIIADDSELKRKVRSLSTKVQDAFSSGKVLQFQADAKTPPLDASINGTETTNVPPKVSDVSLKSEIFCCSGLYKDERPSTEHISDLLKEVLKFRPHHS